MLLKINGIAASDGVAIGKAYLFEKTKLEISQEKISSDQVESEKEKIIKAIDDYVNDINSREVSSEAAKHVAQAHLEIATDPELKSMVFAKIDSLTNAESALFSTTDEMAMVFEMMDDAYLKERAADYRDVGENLLYNVKGVKAKNLSNLDDDYIIIANDLTPTETSTMDKEHVLGFATNLGGKTSHSSIIAQTLGIPAVVGMKDITTNIENGELIILDALEGVVIKNPDSETVERYEKLYETIKSDKELTEKYKFETPISKDGRKVEVACNIGNISDLKSGLENGAQGVGLFRTEFLYMEASEFPNEEVQYEAYKEAAELLEGKPILIRTLDIGGDKGLDYFEFPVEENPFLGWRALRIGFDRKDILRTQLRAILRSSAHGNVKILLPMIISVEEIKTIQAFVEEFKEELRQEGHAFDENIEVGIMIETPASVFVARDLIEHCDYFSIGTNDLTQYILAVDRGNEKISHLYDYFNPAVLRAIKEVIDASHSKGKWTGMCGSMASDTLATYLLLGMGLDEFSAVGAKVPTVKSIIINSNYEEAKSFADEVLKLSSVEEIRSLLKDKTNELKG